MNLTNVIANIYRFVTIVWIALIIILIVVGRRGWRLWIGLINICNSIGFSTSGGGHGREEAGGTADGLHNNSKTLTLLDPVHRVSVTIFSDRVSAATQPTHQAGPANLWQIISEIIIIWRTTNNMIIGRQ